MVSRWKRNVVRVLLTLSVCAVGVLARDSYAYLAAFSGAIGCSLLAYVLPCVIHLRLCARTEPAGYVLLHVTIIGLAVVASAFTLFTIVMKIVTGDAL